MIDELMDHLDSARLYSVVDCLWGYWNVPMSKDSKDKVAISTKFNLFRFLRMPFGLPNAPAIFQRLMDSVLRDLQWVCCLVYLDDIIIYSRTFSGHLVYLTEVLSGLCASNMKLKSKKCTFIIDKVDYLDFKLITGGIVKQQHIVEAVASFPTPNSASEVKSFLGLAGFYRKFIRGFASHAAPLHGLLKKGVDFVWTKEHQTAFEQLRQILISAPVLRLPDFARNFVLVTDARIPGVRCGPHAAI